LKSIKVSILGRELLLKSEAGDEYISEVADYVKAKIESVQKNQAIDIVPTLILAALNIAEEYLQVKKERESLINGVEDRSIQLLRIIDSRLS
jgi:cell division protein ZapA (FtsZ GTPase activity inhibitor)